MEINIFLVFALVHVGISCALLPTYLEWPQWHLLQYLRSTKPVRQACGAPDTSTTAGTDASTTAGTDASLGALDLDDVVSLRVTELRYLHPLRIVTLLFSMLKRRVTMRRGWR